MTDPSAAADPAEAAPARPIPDATRPIPDTTGGSGRRGAGRAGRGGAGRTGRGGAGRTGRRRPGRTGPRGPRHRRAFGLLAAVLSVVVLGGSTVTIAVAWAGAGSEPAVPSARYLPAEGLRWLLVSDASAPRLVQSRYTVAGLSAADALSDGVGASAVELANSGAVVRVTTLGVRTIVTTPDGGSDPTQGRAYTAHQVLAATPDGVQETVLDGGGDLLATPPITVLPADPRPGARWAAATTLSGGGEDLVTADVRFAVQDTPGPAPVAGCLTVTQDWHYTTVPSGPLAGTTLDDEHMEVTWCPGIGPWESRTPLGTGRLVDAATARAAVAALPVPAPQATGGGAPDGAVIPVWLRGLGSTPTAAPVAGPGGPGDAPAGAVVVDADNALRGLHGLSAGSGAERFLIPGLAPVYARPAVLGDAATGPLVVAADVAGLVTAADLPDGFIRWQTRLDGVPMRVQALPARGAAARLAVLTTTGRLFLLDASDGSVRATVDGDGVGVGLAADGAGLVAVFTAQVVWIGPDGAVTATAVPATEPTTDPAPVDPGLLPEGFRPPGTGGPVVLVGAVDGTLLRFGPGGRDLGAVTLFQTGPVQGLVAGAHGVAAFSRPDRELTVLTAEAQQVHDAGVYSLIAVDDLGPAGWVATTAGSALLLDDTGRISREITMPQGSSTLPLRAGAVAVGADLWVATNRGLVVAGGALG